MRHAAVLLAVFAATVGPWPLTPAVAQASASISHLDSVFLAFSDTSTVPEGCSPYDMADVLGMPFIRSNPFLSSERAAVAPLVNRAFAGNRFDGRVSAGDIDRAPDGQLSRSRSVFGAPARSCELGTRHTVGHIDGRTRHQTSRCIAAA